MRARLLFLAMNIVIRMESDLIPCIYLLSHHHYHYHHHPSEEHIKHTYIRTGREFWVGDPNPKSGGLCRPGVGVEKSLRSGGGGGEIAWLWSACMWVIRLEVTT